MGKAAVAPHGGPRCVAVAKTSVLSLLTADTRMAAATVAGWSGDA